MILGPIISIEEAREILGDEASSMADSELEQLIDDLDLLARYALKEARRQRKEDALLLAQLIYDIYKEN